MIRKISITARLTVLFALTSAIVLAGLGLLVARSLDSHFADEDYAALSDRMETFAGFADYSDRTILLNKINATLGSQSGLLVNMSLGGEIIYSSEGFDFSIPAGIARQQDEFEWRQAGQKYRGVGRRINTGSPSGEMQIVLGLSTEIHDHFMRSFNRTFVMFITAATLVSGLLGGWAARKGLAPLRAMAASAQAVTGGDLQERMAVASVPVEIAELAVKLNTMLDRLQRDLKRLADFSSDIAHELRTPITNMMTQTHVTLSQPRTVEKYQEILLSNSEEMQRLSRMTSDMLFLAKTENGLNLPTPETVDLAAELAAVVDFYEALAEDKDLHVRVSGAGRVVGDRLMIRRAISNVLSNAIRHADPASQIIASITEDGREIKLAISNAGPEIPSAQLAAIFDRFFRVDKSRSRPENEGVGLGLSITKAIMSAHHGHIAAESAHGSTTFKLYFPASPGSPD